VLFDFGRSYTDAVGFPSPIMHLSSSHLLAGALGVIAAVAAMSLWPLLSILRLSPQSAIRGDSPGSSAASSGAAVRALSALRNHLILFYPLRNLARMRGVSATTVISVALALGVSLSYLFATDSFNRTIERNFSRDQWNVAAGFLVPLWQDELGPYRNVDGVQRLEGYLRGAVRLNQADRREPALVTGIPAADSMRRINIIRGRGLTSNDTNAILLEHKLAGQLGANPGDTLTLRKRGDEYRVRVAGIFSGTMPGSAYAPLATVQKWMEMDGQVTGVLVRADGAVKPVADRLESMAHVASVTPKSQLSRKVRQITSEAIAIIYIATTFSIVVALIILLASTSFTVLERRREYGVLRVLGFRPQVVGGILTTEVFTLGAAGTLLAVPVGFGMASLLIQRLSEAWFKVIPTFGWQSVAVIAVPALVLVPVSALPSLKTVLETPLTEMLRQRRVG
jgi:ABC-type lipoprotein release transport system permease subunit